MIEVFCITRFPKDAAECYALGVSHSDDLFLTGGGRWSRDHMKAVCFLTSQAATLFHRRMRWQDRERSEVISLQLHEGALQSPERAEVATVAAG